MALVDIVSRRDRQPEIPKNTKDNMTKKKKNTTWHNVNIFEWGRAGVISFELGNGNAL